MDRSQIKQILTSPPGPVAAWITLSLLRTLCLWCHYAFPDPFGAAMVARVDRFLPFHAMVEAGTIAQLLLPFAVLAIWKPGPSTRMSWIVGGLYLVWGQFDLEILRFFRQHATLAYLGTYLRPQAVFDSTTWLSLKIDPLGIARSVLLCASELALAMAFAKRARPTSHRFMSPIILLVAGVALGTSPWWINYTTNRIERILPPTYVIGRDVAALALGEADAVEDSASRTAFARLRLRLSDSMTWVPQGQPFLHAPLETACARGWTTKNCLEDADHDGFDRRSDCDDNNATVHPGAADIPSDGIDQDCSGTDSLPNNIVVLLVESLNRRAVLKILEKPGTLPNLRRLEAMGGAWYLNGRSNGFPSVYGVASTFLGLWSHPQRNYFTSSTGNVLKGFPEYLPDGSWTKIAVSGADPTFDNQMPWLRKWFPRVEFDPNNGSDKSDSVITTRALGLLDSAAPGKPYLLFLATHNTHSPFQTPSYWRPEMPQGTDFERYERALEYFDFQLGRLLEGLAKRPDFNRTVFLVSGDHGFPVMPVDNKRPEGFAPERTATLIGIFSSNQSLHLPTGRLHRVASQTDIGPTVLGLSGIRACSHFQGRDLRDTSSRGSLFFKEGQWEYHSDTLDLFGESLTAPVWRQRQDDRFEPWPDTTIRHQASLVAKATTHQIWVDSLGSRKYLDQERPRN